MAEHYEVGDIVKLKKPHPCGSSEWEILRVGADFRLKCTGCGQRFQAMFAIHFEEPVRFEIINADFPPVHFEW